MERLLGYFLGYNGRVRARQAARKAIEEKGADAWSALDAARRARPNALRNRIHLRRAMREVRRMEHRTDARKKGHIDARMLPGWTPF